MADPQHVPVLDRHDRLTVVAYRIGLLGAALSVLAAAAAQITGEGLALAWLGLAASTGLVIVNVHLYAKTIRWVIVSSGAMGLVLLVGAPSMPSAIASLVFHGGIGFLFAAISALALKEWFCFRIPGLRLVPLLLAGSLIPLLAGGPQIAAGLLSLAGALLAVLAVGKMRQPLHYDIGDKSQYQL